ncbi:MAG TPA: DUF1611 domain-containing protein [Steroidobacteraceae bacterium]|nr:DUF1611 domain-containing protein [Steroidobacteraceae bacterium]
MISALKAPYLLFLGSARTLTDAKTAAGIAYWRRELCCGQLRLPGCEADTGLPDLTLEAAAARGARSFVIGVAPMGGQLELAWLELIRQAARLGYDIVSGMHTRLGSIPGLAELAGARGGRLIDVRVPPPDIKIATGTKRPGRRLLTVGTDCAVGKKYTALALERALRKSGHEATFRATGQTGILIAGGGIPIDAVVSDFVAGAAEALSPANEPTHWDVIEGQGSLFHPSYAAVTLGLIHGSQPDALVLCHDLSRTAIEDVEGYPIPPFNVCITRYVEAARLTNPAVRCIGVSVNSSGVSDYARRRDAIEAELGLPCVDPIREGVGKLTAALERTFR